jgi:ElaB/YqjD/DUF883 family membrane-anchored ribosome-binding protein
LKQNKKTSIEQANTMNKHNHHHAKEETRSVAEGAKALLTATADVAGYQVAQARKRLTLAMDNAKEMAGNARDKAVAGAKATDQAVREHPYQAIAIALGTGALVGCVLARRQARKSA